MARRTKALAEVTAAARTFVKLSNPDDEMFVVNFNEHVTLGMPAKVVRRLTPKEREDLMWPAQKYAQTAEYCLRRVER